jgi:hypothetical protein
MDLSRLWRSIACEIPDRLRKAGFHFDNLAESDRVAGVPMTALLSSIVAVSAATSPAEDFGRLLVWIAVPAVILGAAAAALIKRAILSGSRFRSQRPGTRTFVWVAIADMVAWGVLWPALLVVRIQGVAGHRGLWVFALMLVVTLGYIANRYGFGKAFDPAVAGSLRGTLLAELFTILMPVLSVLFGILIFWLLGFLGF